MHLLSIGQVKITGGTLQLHLSPVIQHVQNCAAHGMLIVPIGRQPHFGHCFVHPRISSQNLLRTLKSSHK